MPSFNAISRRYTKNLLLAQEKYKFCKQGGKLDYSRYSQVSLLTLCYHWQGHIWYVPPSIGNVPPLTECLEKIINDKFWGKYRKKGLHEPKSNKL